MKVTFQETVRFITETCRTLNAQQDLSPRNETVNHVLRELVARLTQEQFGGCGEALAVTPALQEERIVLPALCGRAEQEMEIYWARSFLAQAPGGMPQLRRFWYYQNYEALVEKELVLIGGRPIKTLVFLGGGALPLSALLMVRDRPDLTAICVDWDPVACTLARQLVARLGLADTVHIVESTAVDFPFKDDQLVMYASLLTGRAPVYEACHRAGVPAFLVRDVEGAYCYLYKAAPLPDQALYGEVGRTTPSPDIINTTRLFTRR